MAEYTVPPLPYDYAALEPHVAGTYEGVSVHHMEPDRLEIAVRAYSRGMLVLSEMFSPGWRATVNGGSTRIYRADAALRGILVPTGDSRIILEYAPASVYFGALLTFAAFFGVLAAWVVSRVRR